MSLPKPNQRHQTVTTSYRTEPCSVKPEGTPAPQPTAFVMLPDSIIFDQSLSPMDVRVCAALLTYARTDDPTACPSQELLAERLGCSVDTIQRAEAKLVAAGLMTTKRHRRADGQLGRRVCNLSAILEAIKAIFQAARLRRGQGAPPSSASSARPHPRGVREYSQPKASKVQPTPAPTAPPEPERDAVVVLLTDIGLSESQARKLARGFTSDQIKRAVAAYRATPREKIRSAVAWLTEAARSGWAPPAPKEIHDPGTLPSGAKPVFVPAPRRAPVESLEQIHASTCAKIPALARLRQKIANT
jgi:DNA-binding MarR family transcriptional regulator